MRGNKYLIGFLIAFVCFSCTDANRNNIDNSEKDINYDAVISFTVQTPYADITRADDAVSSNNHPDSIRRLTVFVYQNNQLIAYKDSVNLNGVYAIPELKVSSGELQLYVFANLKQKLTEKATLADLESLDLLDEKNGNLTMKSESLSCSAFPGHNYIGFGNQQGAEIVVDHNGTAVSGIELTGSPIQMVRYVSRIHLSAIRYKLSANYDDDVNFSWYKTDTIFYANINQFSRLLPDAGGSYQPASDAGLSWLHGAYAKATGTLKDDSGTDKAYPRYLFSYKSNSVTSVAKYPFDNGYYYSGKQEATHNLNHYSYNPNPLSAFLPPDKNHFGSYCYVYENAMVTKPTLLIVVGTLRITYKSGLTKEFTNCYWTVVVNAPGQSDYGQAFQGKHDYIRRNNIYDVKLTITGPGSNDPFSPMSSTHISADVEVKAWNVIEQTEEVD